MASWCRGMMIIAAKIVVRKSFVGVDVAECQSATVLDVACDGSGHHFVVSYADPTENGTVRPKPRWLLRGSEFPISVTDKVGGRSLRKVRIGRGKFRGSRSGCIHHRPPHRSHKSETVSNTGRTGKHAVPLTLWEDHRSRPLCCKRGAVTVSLTPVTASCRPDRAARQLLNRERARAAADAPSPRP
jgi:hypothetical protein